MNTIPAINFGQRIRIAKKEESEKELKEIANSASGIGLMTTAATSGVDVLATSNEYLTGSESNPPGFLISSWASPELALWTLSNVNPSLIISSEAVSAPLLGKLGKDIIDKNLPSDENDDNNSKDTIENDD